MLCRRISRYGTRFPTNYIFKSTETAINRGDSPRARGRNPHGRTLTRSRGRREYPVYASRSSRAPALCSRSFHCCRSCGLCSACSALLGRVGPPSRHSSARAVAVPVPWGPFHCCGAFFSYLCLGVSFAIIAISRNIIARLVVWACPPLWGGCPCRAPGPGAAGPPGGPPLRGSPFGRHIGPSGGFFSASAVCSGHGCRVFPLGAVARGLPPCPPARTFATATHFLSGPGGRGCPLPCSALRACAPRGGRHAPAPCTPSGGPTRAAVFFIVLGPAAAPFCIKKHK